MYRFQIAAMAWIACCLTNPVWSEDAPPGDQGRGPFFERMMKEFDKDSDGKLNEEERATAVRLTEQFLGRLRERGNAGQEFTKAFKQFDKDGDGKLNDEERAAAMKAREGFGKKGPPVAADLDNPPEFVLKRFDKDGDGKLNEEEKAAVIKNREEMRKGGIPPGRLNLNNPPEMVLKRFDKDGDGKWNDAERAAAMEAMAKMGLRPGFPSREEMVKRFDKDGDGKLNATEEAAGRAEMEKRFGRPGAAGGLAPGEGKPLEPKLDKAELIQKFDKDGDGKLNAEERAAALEGFQKRDRQK